MLQRKVYWKNLMTDWNQNMAGGNRGKINYRCQFAKTTSWSRENHVQYKQVARSKLNETCAKEIKIAPDWMKNDAPVLWLVKF